MRSVDNDDDMLTMDAESTSRLNPNLCFLLLLIIIIRIIIVIFMYSVMKLLR